MSITLKNVPVALGLNVVLLSIKIRFTGKFLFFEKVINATGSQ